MSSATKILIIMIALVVLMIIICMIIMRTTIIIVRVEVIVMLIIITIVPAYDAEKGARAVVDRTKEDNTNQATHPPTTARRPDQRREK